jgi:exodeoxyribonuclease-5
MASKLRLTPLMKDKEVLGQEQVSNEALPIMQDKTKPKFRLTPPDMPNVKSAPMGGTVEGFDEVDFSELDRDIAPDQNIEAQLAQTQDGWDLLGAAAARSATEIGLGTLEGFSYLADWEQMSDYLKGDEQEFTNWFADAMKQGKEAVRAGTPIYQTETAQEGFAPFDSTWWASNADSIVSTVSMMIPAWGAVRGLSLAGKGLRGLAGLNAATKAAKAAKGVKKGSQIIGGVNKALGSNKLQNIASGTSQAVVSRYMENTMEAAETYESTFQEAMAQGMSEEEAKLKGGDAARTSWSANWVNLAFDVAQYMTLTKGPSIANVANKEFRKGLLKKAGDYIGGMASEAAEEGIQFVTAQEAQRSAMTDKPFLDLKNIGTRMGDYLSDPEMQSAMFLGAFGGGLFQAIGKGADVVSGMGRNEEAYLATVQSLDNGDIATAHTVQDTNLLKQAYAYARAGKIGNLRTFYEEMAAATDEELLAKDMTQEEIADKRVRDAEILEQIDFIGENYSRIWDNADTTDQQKTDELSALFNKDSISRILGKVDAKYEVAKKKALEGMTQDQFALKENQTRLDILKDSKKNYEKNNKEDLAYAATIAEFDKRIKQSEENITKAKENLKAQGLSTTEVPTTTTSAELFGSEVSTEQFGENSLVFQQENLGVHNAALDGLLSQMSQPDYVERRKKDLEKQTLDKSLAAVDHTIPISKLETILNNPSLSEDGKKKVQQKIDDLTNSASEIAPIPSDSKTKENDIKRRYQSNLILKNDLAKIAEAGGDISGIVNGETFANKYANNAEFKKVVDELYSDLQKERSTNVNTNGPAPVDVAQPTGGSPSTAGNVDTTADYNTNNASIMRSNEYALYTYDEDTGMVSVTGIEDVSPKKLLTTEALEAILSEKLGREVKLAPFRGSAEYESPGPYILREADNQAIAHRYDTITKNGVSEPFMKPNDFRILNNPDVQLAGKKITLRYLLDYDFNPADLNSKNKNGAVKGLVAVVVEHEGKEYTVGMLPDVGENPQTENAKKIAAMRQEMHNAWLESGQTSGVFNFESDITIDSRTNGEYNRTQEFNLSPREILNEEKEPLFFGTVIGRDKDGKVKISTNGGEKVFKDNHGFSIQTTWDANSLLGNYPGQTVMFIRSASGLYLPAYMKAMPLSSNEKLTQEVMDLLEEFETKIKEAKNDQDIKRLQDNINSDFEGIIAFNIQYNKATGNFSEVFKEKATGPNEASEAMSMAEIKKLALNKAMRVDAKKINSSLEYNQQMADEGRVKIDISPEAFKTLGSRVKLNLNNAPTSAQPAPTQQSPTIPTTKDGKPILQTRTDKKGRTIEVEAVLSQDGSIVTTKYEAYRTDEKGRRKLSSSGYVTTVGELRSKLLEADGVDALQGLDDSTEVVIREESTGDTGSSVTFTTPGTADVRTLTNGLIVTPFNTTTAPTTENLNKPFVTVRDGSGKMVSVSTETTEKDGVKKTKFKSETITKKGRPVTQKNKSYNTFEELVEDIGIDLNTEENESALKLVETLQKIQGDGVSVKVLEIREDTNKSSAFYGTRSATIRIGSENIEILLSSQPTTEGTVEIPVNDMTIVYNPQTGEMTFKTTGGVPNERVRNKVLVEYETSQGTVRNVQLTDRKGKVTKYAVLSDGRIISLNDSSFGKQLKAKGLVNKILGQAGEVPAPKVAPTPSSKKEPTPSPTPKRKRSKNKTKRPGKDRKRTAEAKEDYEQWNEKEELAWFKKNYPNVPIEVLKDLKEIAGKGGPDLWGLFTNASVYIQSNAAKGTAYHEGFHVVFNLMLTEKERNDILKLGETFAKGTINIEEHWADVFMEYQMTEGKIADTIPAKVADFFKRLWHLIRIAGERYGVGSANMNDYMYRTSRGLYNNGLIRRVGDIDFKKNITRFKRVKSAQDGFLNPAEKIAAKRFINGSVINTVLPDYRDEYLQKEGTDPETIEYNNRLRTLDDKETLQEIFKRGKNSKDPRFSIQGIYEEFYRGEYDELLEDSLRPEEAKLFSPEQESQLRRTLDTLATRADDPGQDDYTLTFNPFIKKLVTSLSNYGIKYNVYSEEASNSEFTEGDADLLMQDEDVVENWMVKEKFIGSFEKFNQKANRLFASVYSDQEFAGYSTFEDPNNVKANLIHSISGARSSEDMMNKLFELTKLKENYGVIYETLQEDTNLQDEFWINIGQRENIGFMMMQVNNDGTATPFLSNKRNLKEDLIDNLRYSMKNSIHYNSSKGTYNVKNIDSYVDTFSKIVDKYKKSANDQNLEAEDLKEIKKIIKDLRIPLTNAEIDALFGSPKESSKYGVQRFKLFAGVGEEKGFSKMLSTLQKGKDPFFNEDIESFKSVENMAEAIVSVKDNMYQPSFKSSAGEMIYSFLQSRHMFRHLNNMKQPLNQDGGHQYLDTFMEDPFYKDSPFLKRMRTDAKFREAHKFVVFDGLRKQGEKFSKEYADLTPQELEAVNINAFSNIQGSSQNKKESNYGYFMMPVFADSTSSAFLRSEKLSERDALKNIVETAKQEKARVDFVKKMIADGTTDTLTDSMIANGPNFQLFPFLNGKNLSKEGTLEKLVKAEVEKLAQLEYDRLIEDGVLNETVDVNGNRYLSDPNGIIDSKFIGGNEGYNNVMRYLMNNMYMNMQTMMTFNGDPALFKGKGEVNFVDVYKRAKGIWSPGDYINVNPNAKYNDGNGNIISVRPTYNVSYVQDPTEVTAIASEHTEALKDIFPDEGNKNIRDAYKDLNNTDGATWIDIVRFRDIQLGTGQWSDEKQKVFNAIMNGEKLPTNAAIVFNPIKPFQYVQNQVEHADGTRTMVTTMHKNAEMLLVPEMAIGNPKIQEMMEKMGYTFANGTSSYNAADRVTDSIMFTSAVKVGRYNVQENINTISSENVITMNNSDFRIQQATPEHHIDTDILFGTQLRKIIMNIDLTKTYKTPQGEMSGQEIFDKYQEAMALNIKESYDELRKMFYDDDGKMNKERLLSALQEEAVNRELGEDIEEAFEWLDENKTETVLPMWHPHIATRVEAMIYSFFKNRITKQRTAKGAGMSVFNTTSYGFDKNNSEGLKKPVIKFNKDRSINHYEALLPAHLKELEYYADENGIIDVNNVPDDVKKGIFYRIPTEDFYSVFHIKVVGYMPASAGGQIVLPDEITTIAGLDFDIDKLFGMMYNLKTSKDGGLEKVPSSMESKEARDNMILDMAFNVLSSRNVTENQLRPGNFNTLKKMANGVQLLRPDTGRTLNPMLPSTRREIFNRNMTGNGLIGIFANHNANQMLTVHGNFLFGNNMDINGKKGLASLSEHKKGGVRITDALAEFLAAAVDTASDPVFSFLNVTQLTSDWAATMVRVGVPLETATAVMSSPVVTKLIDKLNKEGKSDPTTVNTFLADIRTELFNELVKRGEKQGKDGDTINNDYKEYQKKGYAQTLTFDIVNEGENASDYTGSIADLIRGEGKKVSELTDKQLSDSMLLVDYLTNKVLPNSEALKPTVAAMRFDSVSASTKPSVAENIAIENKYQTALLKGEVEIDENGTKLLSGFQEFMEDADTPVPYAGMFYRYSVKEANKIVKDVTGIPYADKTSIFNNVADWIESMSSKTSLRPEEKNTIYRAVLTVIGSGYISHSPDVLSSISKELPSKINTYLSDNPDSPYKLFLNRFVVQPSKELSGFDILTFNTSGLVDTHKQELRDIWTSMLESSNETEREIALNLVKYSYAHSGYVYGPSSFSDIIPTSYISEMHEDPNISYTDYLKQEFEKDHDNQARVTNIIPGITEQVVRNFFTALPLPNMLLGKDTGPAFRDENNNIVVHVTPENVILSSNLSDVVEQKKSTAEDRVPSKYIKISYTEPISEITRTLLMQETGKDPDTGNSIYVEIPRLGIKNEIIETDFSVVGTETPIVISRIADYVTKSTPELKETETASASELGFAVGQLLGDPTSEILESLHNYDTSAPIDPTHPLAIAFKRMTPAQQAKVKQNLKSSIQGFGVDMTAMNFNVKAQTINTINEIINMAEAPIAEEVQPTIEPVTTEEIRVPEQADIVKAEDGTYDVEYGDEGVIAERLETYEEAVEVAQQFEYSEVETPQQEEVVEEGDAIYELFPGVFANKGQREAIDQIVDFLESPEKTFLLTGKGGTGKTTIVRKIVETLGQNKEGYGYAKVLAIAPSHKAKKVLDKSLKTDGKYPDRTQVQTKTIASALAIKLDEVTGEFGPDTFARNKGDIPISDKADLVIIDETSMVSDEMYEEILKFAHSKSKIIFMGDQAQLPPVGQESDSIVFRDAKGYELTEKMRQASGSPIIGIGTKVAENAENDVNRVANPIQESDRVNSVDPVSGSKILWESSEEKALNDFITDLNEANEDVNHVKIVTFNNQNNKNSQSVKSLNEKIRDKMFGDRADTERFIPGEIMTAYDSYNPENSKNSEDIVFHNSEDFIILDVTKPKNVKVKVEVYSRAKGSRSFEGEFNAETLTLKNEDGKTLDNIMVVSQEGKNYFNSELSKLFKTDGQLAYALKAKFANLEHGYAITSHKAQGSTYKNVYTMEDNIMGPANGGSIKAKNQSLYVAVSRPSDKLVMVSSKNAGVSEEITTAKEELPSGIETGTEVTGDTQAMFGDLATELGEPTQTQPTTAQPATTNTRTSNIAGREIAYTIDKSLSNKDGSKRFAEATKENEIFINPVTNLQELYDYMEGKEGGVTSKQKLQVLKELEKQGYTIDRIKGILSSKKLANSFLILHEQDHIDNNDRDVYWKNGKDLLTPDKIAIETRATVVALQKLDTGQSDMQQSKLTITEEQLKTINDNLTEIPWLLSMDDFNAATRAEQEKLMHCLK